MVASRSFLQWLLVHLKFTLGGEVLFCWYKWGLISMSYNRSTSSWKPWRWLRFCLILTMRDDKGYMHQFQPRVTCKVLKQQQRTKSKYILLWNFLQLIMKTIPISTIIIESCEMKKMIPIEFKGMSIETEATTQSEFHKGGKATVEQILGSKGTKKSK